MMPRFPMNWSSPIKIFESLCKATAIVFTFGNIFVSNSGAHPLEKGLAVTDPLVIQELERQGYGIDFFGKNLGRTPCPELFSQAGSPNLFERQPLCGVAAVLSEEIERAQANSLDPIGKKADQGSKLRTAFLSDNDARIELVGVINRMDRAFRLAREPGFNGPDSCGELRFIYRFGYDEQKKLQIASRLPFTLNVVLRTRATGDKTPCARFAQGAVRQTKIVSGSPTLAGLQAAQS